VPHRPEGLAAREFAFDSLGNGRGWRFWRFRRFSRSSFDFAVKFAPEDWNFPGGRDPNPNRIPFNSSDHDLNIVTDHDRFPYFT